MKWIGSNKLLQIAIASIDDRLVFLSILKELDKRGIKYKPLSVEPLVGGHLIQIVKFVLNKTKQKRIFFLNNFLFFLY